MRIARIALVGLFWAALAPQLPVGALSQAAGPPDLSIKSVRIDPAEPYANSYVTMSVEVENAGPERVDNVQIIVNFSKLFAGQSETASLGPGETRLVTSSKYHPAPGKYEITASLSLGGTAYGLEENKSNNEKRIDVVVREGREPGTSPDLALAAVKIGETGGAYEVEAVVRNIGVDPASCGFSVNLVTEVTKGTRQVMAREDEVIPANRSFAPGAEKKIGPFPIVDKAHPGTLENGTYVVKIGVYNTYGTIMEETDSRNNYYQGTFTIGEGGTEPAPDLSIKSVRIDPAEPYANSDVTVHAEVENAGAGTVDNVQIIVNFGKLFAGQSVTASLGPGETKVVSSQIYHPAPGKYEITASLSLGGSAYGLEENKANNEKKIAFEVREGRAPGTSPDLALTAVKIGETGGAYQIEATVRNIGVDPASSGFPVCLVTEVTKGTRQVMKREDEIIPANQALAPGTERKVGPFPVVDSAHPGTFDAGEYHVTIGVYNVYGTRMEEIDSQNNYYQGAFTATETIRTSTLPAGIKAPKAPIRPLRPDFFTASPIEIFAGQNVLLKWSFPAAAEAALLINGKTTPLALPAGELRVVPSCDPQGGPFCYSACRIVGKTKTGAKFERELKIKVNKR